MRKTSFIILALQICNETIFRFIAVLYIVLLKCQVLYIVLLKCQVLYIVLLKCQVTSDLTTDLTLVADLTAPLGLAQLVSADEVGRADTDPHRGGEAPHHILQGLGGGGGGLVVLEDGAHQVAQGRLAADLHVINLLGDGPGHHPPSLSVVSQRPASPALLLCL